MWSLSTTWIAIISTNPIHEWTTAIGIVKHIHVDDAALIHFYNTYFKYPIYKDEKRQINKKL
jgi:hypothetical protein